MGKILGKSLKLVCIFIVNAIIFDWKFTKPLFFTIKNIPTFLYRIGLSSFKSSREETYSDFARSYDQNICQKFENCGESLPDIRCSTCWKPITSQNVTFLNNMTTPNAKSAHNMNLFGHENILVQEFVNPHDYHFQSIQVEIYYYNFLLCNEKLSLLIMSILCILTYLFRF